MNRLKIKVKVRIHLLAILTMSKGIQTQSELVLI